MCRSYEVKDDKIQWQRPRVHCDVCDVWEDTAPGYLPKGWSQVGEDEHRCPRHAEAAK